MRMTENAPPEPRKLTPMQMRFVDEYVIDMNATAAARAAGSKAERLDQAGYEFLRNPEVKAEVAERLKELHETAQISAHIVIREFKRIATADIRKAVKWIGNHISETDIEDGGETLVQRDIVSNLVELINSDELDDDTARAISEISQTATGGIRIKFHDKNTALTALAKHFGIIDEALRLKGPEGGPVQLISHDATVKEAAEAFKRTLEGD